jgi:ABC-type multidrug transport system ATPase subunit
VFELTADNGVRVHNLHYSAPARVLFQGFSAHFPPGVSLLCGDEGTGKTTLLRLMAEQLPPATAFWCDTQQEAWAQRLCTDLLAHWLAPFGREQPQAAEQEQADRTQAERLAERLAEVLDLTPHLHKPFYMLSAGSKRKLGLLAAFCSGAPVLLLDQPFAALDAASVRQVCGLLAERAAAGGQVVIVADYLPPEGVPLAATVDLDRHHPA